MSVGRCVSSYGYEGYYTTNTSKVVVAFGFPRFFRQLRVYSKVAYIRSPSLIFAVLCQAVQQWLVQTSPQNNRFAVNLIHPNIVNIPEQREDSVLSFAFIV